MCMRFLLLRRGFLIPSPAPPSGFRDVGWEAVVITKTKGIDR